MLRNVKISLPLKHVPFIEKEASQGADCSGLSIATSLTCTYNGLDHSERTNAIVGNGLDHSERTNAIVGNGLDRSEFSTRQQARIVYTLRAE